MNLSEFQDGNGNGILGKSILKNNKTAGNNFGSNGNRKRQFVHKMFVHNFRAAKPPLPNQQSDGFPLEFLLKGPQTELRTLSQNCEQTLQKVANKQNYEQTGVSEAIQPPKKIPCGQGQLYCPNFASHHHADLNRNDDDIVPKHRDLCNIPE